MRAAVVVTFLGAFFALPARGCHGRSAQHTFFGGQSSLVRAAFNGHRQVAHPRSKRHLREHRQQQFVRRHVGWNVIPENDVHKPNLGPRGLRSLAAASGNATVGCAAAGGWPAASGWAGAGGCWAAASGWASAGGCFRTQHRRNLAT